MLFNKMLKHMLTICSTNWMKRERRERRGRSSDRQYISKVGDRKIMGSAVSSRPSGKGRLEIR
jgi:hypothetical protein